VAAEVVATGSHVEFAGPAACSRQSGSRTESTSGPSR
jgi:hypothetical protein